MGAAVEGRCLEASVGPSPRQRKHTVRFAFMLCYFIASADAQGQEHI